MEVELESHRRRWVVRISRPDLRRGKVRRSGHSTSTEERIEHSTSFGSRTGRPLPVNSADGRQLAAIDGELDRRLDMLNLGSWLGFMRLK